jgi:hypothetical protein
VGIFLGLIVIWRFGDIFGDRETEGN